MTTRLHLFILAADLLAIDAALQAQFGSDYAGTFDVSLSSNGTSITHYGASWQGADARAAELVAWFGARAGTSVVRGLATGFETPESVPYCDVGGEVPIGDARYSWARALTDLGLSRYPVPGPP